MPSESVDHQQQQRRGGGQSKLAVTLTPPQQEQEHIPCPRCDSTNTKFCYYNNYNFSQPRHFCKSCRRYWTQGGTLRDIPVGGGSRKNAKRSRTCASYATASGISASGIAAAVASSGGGATSSAELFGAAGPVFVYNGMGGMQLGSDVKGNNGNLYGGTIVPAGGSFTTLLGNQGSATAAEFLALGGGGHGFGLRLGLGHGFDDVGFGKGLWPFSEVGFGGGHGGVSTGGNGNSVVGNMGNTWQLENGDTGFVGADCFPWPELAISTPGPGNAFK